jgi:hypothetical protein
MRNRLGRTAVALGLALVAVVLLVGGVAETRADDPQGGEAAAPAAQAAPVADDPYPLATGSTADETQLVIFERAYSECASTEMKLLASKYKAADKSKSGVAAAVGRAWASYFKAGADAVRDGREGCLAGFADPNR